MGRKNQPSSGRQVKKGYDYGLDIVGHPVVSEDEHAATQPTGAAIPWLGAIILIAIVLIVAGLIWWDQRPLPEAPMIVPVPVIKPISSVRLAVIQENAGEINPIKHRYHPSKKCTDSYIGDCNEIFTVNGIRVDYDKWAKGQ